MPGCSATGYRLPAAGYRLLLGDRGVTVVRYWRDVESIYAYANVTARNRTARARMNPASATP